MYRLLLSTVALLSIVSAQQLSEADNYNQKLGWLNNYYDALMYPNSTQYLQNITLGSQFFTEDAIGRIDVAGIFRGARHNVEYSFGVWNPASQSNNHLSILPYPRSYVHRSLIVSGNVAQSSILADFYLPLANQSIPLQLDSLFSFSDTGAISAYDTNVKNSAFFGNYLFTSLSPLISSVLGDNYTTPQLYSFISTLAAPSICEIAMANCTGSLQQYNSQSECVDFIRALPFGDLFEAKANTTICRIVHQNMVTYDPEAHCSHIGPSGGDACVPRTYPNWTEEELFAKPFMYDFTNNQQASWSTADAAIGNARTLAATSGASTQAGLLVSGLLALGAALLA